MKAIVFYNHQNGNPTEVELKHSPDSKYWQSQWKRFSEYIGIPSSSLFHVEFEEGEPKYDWELEQALSNWP